MIVSNRITEIHCISKILENFVKIRDENSEFVSEDIFRLFFGENEWELTIRSSDCPASDQKTADAK